jgi:DNA replication protein DnaC
MFKPVTNDKGEEMEPSAPDKRLAFELINYRYVNRLPTIISSEWHIADLSDFDEATGSRIAERSDGFCLDISRDKQRNHRLKGTLAI